MSQKEVGRGKGVKKPFTNIYFWKTRTFILSPWIRLFFNTHLTRRKSFGTHEKEKGYKLVPAHKLQLQHQGFTMFLVQAGRGGWGGPEGHMGGGVWTLK